MSAIVLMLLSARTTNRPGLEYIAVKIFNCVAGYRIQGVAIDWEAAAGRSQYHSSRNREAKSFHGISRTAR